MCCNRSVHLKGWGKLDISGLWPISCSLTDAQSVSLHTCICVCVCFCQSTSALRQKMYHRWIKVEEAEASALLGEEGRGVCRGLPLLRCGRCSVSHRENSHVTLHWSDQEEKQSFCRRRRLGREETGSTALTFVMKWCFWWSEPCWTHHKCFLYTILIGNKFLIEPC